MILELCLPICAIFFSTLLFIVYFFKKKINLFENKMYAIMLGCVLIDSILVTIEKSLVIGKTLNTIDSITLNSISIMNKFDACMLVVITTCIFLYTVLITLNLKEKFKTNLIKTTAIIDMLIFVSIFALKVNLIEYAPFISITGSALIPTYIACGIYTLLSILITLFNINKVTKKHIPLIATVLVFVFLIIVFSFNPYITIISIALTFINFVMYFTIENPDVKMVKELEYAKNTAEKANRAKSDFLSSMSHEIRTPLNAIVGLSEVIKNSDDIDEIHEDANDVVMASKNLLEIVNGILDISKIEADKMEVIESNYNPVETFGEITSLMQPKLDEKNLKLNCNFALDLPNTLYGDKGKLKQIISNILSNAIKYTEKGHIDFNVTCINEKTKCKLQIIISDTGRGIKPEQIDTIFNKFERAEEDKNSTIEGTGLGLAITKSLVEMMGGKILVHSTYGEGSKFTIFLEQKYSKSEDNIKVVKDEKVSYSDKKVLVVDDNKLNIKVASKVLSEFELNIDSADSGFSAIEKIENNEHYDIIFMDIMMPKMSGVETLKKLKEIDNFNTPVVALTADAMEGKSTKYIEVGFNDYLSKPINKDELKRVLNKCLNGNTELIEEKTVEEDPHIHRVIPITDEDIEMLNRKVAEDLAKQKEQEEKEKNNN